MRADDDDPGARQRRLAEAVRRACVEAAVEGFEVAAMRGLCHKGAVEAAVSAVKQVDLEAVIAGLDVD